MNQGPLLSIVTPTYNSMRFLSETAESVKRLGALVEWVVVDNHSTDDTVAYLRGLGLGDRLHLIVNPVNNGNPLLSWKIGARASRGKYITNVGSDDVIPSDGAYRAGLAFLEAHPEVGAAVSKVGYITEAGRLYKYKRIPFARYGRVVSARRMFWTIFLSPTYPVKEGCSLYRRELVERCSFTSDIELLLDMTRVTDFYLIDAVGLHYRNRAISLSAINRHDGFWWPLTNKYLSAGRHASLLHCLYYYRLVIGFLKLCYRQLTPNRI